jgi:hypothetical protein
MGRLTRFLRLPLARWGKWKVIDEVTAADEVPAEIPKRRAIIVRRNDTPTWLAFDCPCDRGHRILLNLDATRRPRWTVTATSPLTIYPSVDDASSTRRCHFLIRAGRVIWARDDLEVSHER